MKLFSILFLFLSCATLSAKDKKDLGFRFKWDVKKNQGQCVNPSGKKGFNPKFIGPCGDLRGMDLQSANLDGVDLSGAIADGVNFSRASLNGAKLVGLHAHGAVFFKSKLNGANLSYANIGGASFKRAALYGAQMKKAYLSGSLFNYAHLSGANLSETHLGGADLSTNFANVRVDGAVFSPGTAMPFSLKIAKQKGMKADHLGYMVGESKKREPVSRIPTSKEFDGVQKKK